MSRSNKYDRPRPLIRTIPFAVIAILLMTIIACKSSPIAPESGEKGSPVDTVIPTSAVDTPAPTEPEATAEASDWSITEIRSRRAELEASAKAVVEGKGGSEDIYPFVPMTGDNAGESFLRVSTEGDAALTAYDVCLYKEKLDSEFNLEWRYECAEPFAQFPSELSDGINAKLAEYAKQFLGVELLQNEGGNLMPTLGFVGNDWIVVVSGETTANRQVHTIWRTDDGTNYYEFGHNNAFSGQVTGACIILKTTGFLCQVDTGADDIVAFKVFGTFDGGNTWQDMNLEIPEEYAGYCISAAFAPYFEGDNGVVFVSMWYRDRGEYGETIIHSFTTSDGGKTWSFND